MAHCTFDACMPCTVYSLPVKGAGGGRHQGDPQDLAAGQTVPGQSVVLGTTYVFS